MMAQFYTIAVKIKMYAQIGLPIYQKESNWGDNHP